MSWWKQRSQLHSGDSSDDVTPGGVVNRSLSPARKSRGKKASADDYPSYAANTNRDDDNDGGYNGGGGYGGGGYNGGYGGGYNGGYGGGGGGAPYGNDTRGITLYGNGGGYNNPPPYGNVSDGYNAPASWGAQDPAAGRTPMYISTREVHVYGAPQNFEDDQRKRGGGGGGGGGFFRPAFEAVGHFVDRRFGLDDRN